MSAAPERPRYRGVKWNKAVALWRAALWVRGEGRQIHLGQFESVEDAAIAHDRAQLFAYRREAELNFPDRAVTAATFDEIRAWALALRAVRERQRGHPGARRNTYRGVTAKRGRWGASITLDSLTIALGGYASEREAAIARDRVVLFLGLDLPLNEPDEARRLGPWSVAECRREAGRARKKTSRAIGVIGCTERGTWDVSMRVGTEHVRVRGFPTERAAAIAHDRLVLGARGPRDDLNFPRRKSKPARVEDLCQEVRAARKVQQHSRYDGVTYSRRTRRWVARLSSWHSRPHELGQWKTERLAAIAVDRARLQVGRDDLNLPRVSRPLGPAAPAELRAEAWRLIKESKTSEFRGVFWNRQAGSWAARIGHHYKSLHLGFFDNEYQAANAYDEAAIKLHKRRAKLNRAT